MLRQVGFFMSSNKKGIVFLILITLAFYEVTAQKVIRNTIVDPTISMISIDASNSFEIEMVTHTENEMMIEAAIEGEYQDDLQLKIDFEGTTINVGAGFDSNFKNPNDKLSAHKVISIALKILLPEYKNVVVFGKECNVNISGNYKLLKVNLDDGLCALNSVSEKAMITTQSGNITVNSSEAKIVADSKYGKVTGDTFEVGENQYILSTITGNIVLNRVE